MTGKAFKRAVRTDKIWFSLPDKDDNDVRFDCVDILPSGLLMDFGEVSDVGGNVIQAIKDLFNGAIREDQQELFWEMTRSREAPIGIDMLQEVAEMLAEAYSTRPTGESSSDGQSKTSIGGGSTGGALRAVSTYSKPEPTVDSA